MFCIVDSFAINHTVFALGVITVILWSGPFIAAFRKWRQDVKDSNVENNAWQPNIEDVF